ncbi:MAG: hypothetical protein WD993_03435 [Thermoleophilaceae bacterium]
MEYALAVILLLALVAAVVARPLVLGVGDDTGESSTHEELAAAKEAKYREIRDARLDLEMGKLTPEHHRTIERELRAEAIEILRRLDVVEGKAPPA